MPICGNSGRCEQNAGFEPVYGFARDTPLAEASRALRQVEAALELGRPSEVDTELRREVTSYNRDDCLSTLRLRDWLESLRAAAEKKGAWIARPTVGSGSPSETIPTLTPSRNRTVATARIFIRR